MNYFTGEPIQVGDHVLIEHGSTPGVVEFIVSTGKDKREWNVDEQGVLVKAQPFGLVFWPTGNNHDSVIYVSRSNT